MIKPPRDPAQTPAVVWAVQQPTGGPHGEPSMDLSPALEWGRLRFMLRDSQNPFRDLDLTLEMLRMADIRPGDYLLLVGNPVLIGLASVVAAESLSVLQMLQWDRARRQYRVATVRVREESPDEQAPALAAPGGRG